MCDVACRLLPAVDEMRDRNEGGLTPSARGSHTSTACSCAHWPPCRGPDLWTGHFPRASVRCALPQASSFQARSGHLGYPGSVSAQSRPKGQGHDPQHMTCAVRCARRVRAATGPAAGYCMTGNGRGTMHSPAGSVDYTIVITIVLCAVQWHTVTSQTHRGIPQTFDACVLAWQLYVPLGISSFPFFLFLCLGIRRIDY